ncbi:MAG: hypothetical protein ACE5IJ_03680 [Thermoplasmata archaeon]
MKEEGILRSKDEKISARFPGVSLALLLVVLLMTSFGLSVIPSAVAHKESGWRVTLVGLHYVSFSPFAAVYFEVYKQNDVTGGYIVYISTHRIQHYLTEISNRITFSPGIEYPGICPGSLFVGYTPWDQQTSATCSGPPDDRVGTAWGYIDIVPGIPWCCNKWRSTLSGDTRYWWKEGPASATWDQLNVVRSGNGFGPGQRIDFYVWYHFQNQVWWWWEHHYRSASWTYYT